MEANDRARRNSSPYFRFLIRFQPLLLDAQDQTLQHSSPCPPATKQTDHLSDRNVCHKFKEPPNWSKSLPCSSRRLDVRWSRQLVDLVPVQLRVNSRYAFPFQLVGPKKAAYWSLILGCRSYRKSKICHQTPAPPTDQSTGCRRPR